MLRIMFTFAAILNQFQFSAPLLQRFSSNRADIWRSPTARSRPGAAIPVTPSPGTGRRSAGRPLRGPGSLIYTGLYSSIAIQAVAITRRRSGRPRFIRRAVQAVYFSNLRAFPFFRPLCIINYYSVYGHYIGHINIGNNRLIWRYDNIFNNCSFRA